MSLLVVDEVFRHHEQLRSARMQLAERISNNAALALRAAKKLLRGSMAAFTNTSMQLAMEIRAQLETTEAAPRALQHLRRSEDPTSSGARGAGS